MSPTLMIACACVGGFAGAVNGQVTFYTASKSADYIQTQDDTPPSGSSLWAFSVQLETTSEADAVFALVEFGGPPSPLALPKIPGLPVFSAFGGAYPTQELLDSDFPEGTYTYRVAGGTLGPQSGTLEMPNSLFPPTVPYLTGDTFSRLQNLDPAVEFEGTFPAFDPPAEATGASIQVSISSRSGQAPVYASVHAPWETVFTIPADTLRNGRRYIFAIAYDSRRDVPGDFPGGGTAGSDFGRVTQFVFDVGCPADFNGDGQADFFDYLDFAQAFANEDLEADFNGDGQIDFFDYLDFAQVFDAEC